MSLEEIRRQFKFIRSIPSPFAQEILATFSPFQIVLSVRDSDFGLEAPVSLQARLFIVLGAGIPGIPISFAVNGKTVGRDIFTDSDGVSSAKTTLRAPGRYVLQAFVGVAESGNPAYDEEEVSVAAARISSSLDVEFRADGKSFKTPVTLLFPFYTGSLSYTLQFPSIVDKGVNNVFLLLAPSQVRVAGDTDVSLPYVKPSLTLSAVSAVLVNEPVVLSAQIATESGVPLAFLPVTFSFKEGKEIVTLNSDSDGKAGTTLRLPEGVYQVQASWINRNFSATKTVESVLPQLSISGPSSVDANTQFKVNVTSRTRDGRVISSLPLALYVDDVFIRSIATDSNGGFTDTLSLAAGSHTVSVFWKDLSQAVLRLIAVAPVAPTAPGQAPAPAPTVLRQARISYVVSMPQIPDTRITGADPNATFHEVIEVTVENTGNTTETFYINPRLSVTGNIVRSVTLNPGAYNTITEDDGDVAGLSAPWSVSVLSKYPGTDYPSQSQVNPITVAIEGSPEFVSQQGLVGGERPRVERYSRVTGAFTAILPTTS